MVFSAACCRFFSLHSSAEVASTLRIIAVISASALLTQEIKTQQQRDHNVISYLVVSYRIWNSHAMTSKHTAAHFRHRHHSQSRNRVFCLET